MSTRSDDQPKPRNRKVRNALLALAVIVIGLGAIYRHYTHPERIRAIAEDYLQSYTNGRVRVGATTFSLMDGVRLFNVTVEEPPSIGTMPADRGVARTPSPIRSPFFHCREIELLHRPMAALLGRFEIESIVAYEPTCRIVRDADDGGTNLSRLLKPVGQEEGETLGAWPTIELHDARVHVVQRRGSRERVVDDLHLTIRGRPSQRNPALYDIAWRSEGGQAARGQSQLDIEAGTLRNVQGGLPWMKLEAVMIAINAKYDAAGTWCDLLGLDGVVRARDYDLSSSPDGESSRSAAIELKNASLSIPISEQEDALSPNDRYLRFEAVDGTIELSAHGIEAEFTGRFHGSPCRVLATMTSEMDKLSTLDDVDFDATASIVGFTLPLLEGVVEEARFIQRWPKLAKFYRNYDPHGKVDLDLSVSKAAGADQPISVGRALLVARGCDASARWFPYRVTELSGSVNYSPEGVVLSDLGGIHGSGSVRVDGKLDSPDRCSAADLLIRGENIPIDDDLWGGMREPLRSIEYVLAPHGNLNIDLQLTRLPCGDDRQVKWNRHATITLNGVDACYTGFPYPLTQLAGTVTMESGIVEVVGVRGWARDGRVEIDGRFAWADQRLADMDVLVIADKQVFDAELERALPAVWRDNIASLSPSGEFDVRTMLSLSQGAPGLLDQSTTLTLKGVTVRHGEPPLDITNIHGTLHASENVVELEDVVGLCHGARLSATGLLPLDRLSAGTDMWLTCTNMKLDSTMQAALPAAWRDALGGWSIDGAIDATTHWVPTSQATCSDEARTTTIHMNGATVRHERWLRGFEDVRGELSLTGEGIRADNLQARFGGAQIVSSFFVPSDESPTDDRLDAAISLTATGLELNSALRELLPASMRRVWDKVRPTGGVNLRLDDLRANKRAPGESPVWSLGKIYVEFVDVAMPGIAGIHELNGRMTGAGVVVDAQGGTSLSGDLHLGTIDILGRRLGGVTSSWRHVQTEDGHGWLAFDSLMGQVYDGRLTGEVQLTFNPDRVSYDLSTMIHGMQIEPFIRAGRGTLNRDEKTLEAKGVADAQLRLSGVLGDESQRQGSGAVEISEGRMYRLPIILAILHVVNLSVPADSAFDDARAQFSILGNQVMLEHIELRGKALALIGSGSMSLPDLGLDLNLMYRSPRQRGRIPIVDDVLQGTSHELLALHVTGPLSRPTVRPKPFGGLTDEIERLFSRKKKAPIKPAKP